MRAIESLMSKGVSANSKGRTAAQIKAAAKKEAASSRK